MKTKRIISLILALTMLVGMLSALCSCGGNQEKISNETTTLVLSTSELDGVFNPFYSSSAPDSSIVGMTQLGMLSADKDGKVSYGEDEACVVLDYEAKTEYDNDNNPIKTVYRFVLKNDIQFSDGSPLTMRDVLFNLYVYLDPAYYGSSTIYSTDIVGLKEYRTQSESESVQDKFGEEFSALASDRILRLKECLEEIKDKKEYKNSTMSEAQMLSELEIMKNNRMQYDELYSTIVDDYKLAKEYFEKELETDYNYARGTAEDIKFTDANKKEVTLTTDTEAFLYNEGLITWNEDEFKFEYSLGPESKNWTEEQAINAIFKHYFPNRVNEVITKWNTANELHTYFSFLEQQKYFENVETRIPNISGIRYANRYESVTVKGKTYDVPVLNDKYAVTNDTNEVLEITINKVDPKAIWNFAFSVAPMFYYSNEEQIAKFDYEENFGVEFGSIEFMDKVIKNPDKIGVPVGAGPYKATTSEGDSSAVTAGTFKANNVVYFERNEHFLFDVKIKYINYQVVPTNLMLEALYSGDVHFVEPSCKQEIIDDINSRKNEGFSSVPVPTNGYGYIGINAEKVPDVTVRRAIMHAINTQYAVDYYLGYSSPITRPMTKQSWAYPTEADEAGQYYAWDQSGEFIKKMLEDEGYYLNSKGVLQKGDHICKYTFTIAGDTTDHPAYQSLKEAAEILNKIGFDIDVKPDINALKKLNNGDLTVWAAAWGAGVDPDMYQVYHIDSTAGSTANWGYRAIRNNAGGKYDFELDLVKELSRIIDAARETLDTNRRIEYYAQALDIVMDLAVELPTYQRSDLFAYNTKVIDVDTLTPASELTSYNGPMSKIWEVGLNETEGSGASGGNGMTVVIVVAALVVAGGAGAGVYFVLKNKNNKTQDKAQTEAGAKKDAEVETQAEASDNKAAEDAPDAENNE